MAELIIIVLAIAFSVLTTLKPIRVSKIKLDMATGPFIAVVVLILFRIIDLEILKNAILGNDMLQPWKIIIIFFSLAYASISVDITGFFDYVAYKILFMVKGNGRKLFLLFYLFASFLTVFTSNDIVILTLTPIIYYIGKHSKISITHLLFAEFFAANTWSMLLYIGNPTNIILASSAGINFLEYTKVMAIPTLLAGLLTFLILQYRFQDEIDQNYSVDILPATFGVRNWIDTFISVFMMLVVLFCFSVSHYMGWEIWKISGITAILFVIEDLIFSFYYWLKKWHLTEFQQEKSIILARLQGIPEEINEFMLTAKRVPWKIFPFVVSFFIFVSLLDDYGFIKFVSNEISIYIKDAFSMIMTMGIFGTVMANIINNQPMSILSAGIMADFMANNSEVLAISGIYAFIVASNLAANLTPLGALAGIMWQKLLSDKNIDISYKRFIIEGFKICPFVLIFTLIALYFSAFFGF